MTYQSHVDQAERLLGRMEANASEFFTLFGCGIERAGEGFSGFAITGPDGAVLASAPDEISLFDLREIMDAVIEELDGSDADDPQAAVPYAVAAFLEQRKSND